MAPFARRQTYAGNGRMRRARTDDSLLPALPGPVNPDREHALAEAFIDAVADTLATPHLQYTHLVRLLDRPATRLDLLDHFPWDVFEMTFRRAERLLVDQLADSATTEAQDLNLGPFDRRDPNVLLYGARHAADMVTEITNEQRRIIRSLVVSAEREGIAPKTLARDIRNAVGLTAKWEGAVTKHHRGMLERGVDPTFAAKQAKKYRDRLLTSRANMIARTEVMRASNEGKLVGWQQAINLGTLTGGGQKRWHTAITNVCPVCLPMDGQLQALNDPFLVTTEQRRMYNVRTPPAHPHCRCTLTYVPPTVDDLLAGTGLTIADLVAEITTGQQREQAPDPEEGTTYDRPPTLVPDPPAWDDQSALRRAYDDDDLLIPPIIPQFPSHFATTRQAEQWMRDNFSRTGIPEVNRLGSTYYLRPRQIDFEDLSSDLANALVYNAVRFARAYPYSWAKTTSYGTAQAIYRSDPATDHLRVPGNVYAQVTNSPKRKSRTLGWNKNWGTKSRLVKFLAHFDHDVATGYHPHFDITTWSGVDATIIHEFTHLIHHRIIETDRAHWADRLIYFIAEETGLDEATVDLSNPTFLSYVKSQVSTYALNNWHEFIAEAFTAYQTQPARDHSPMVRAVGRFVAYYKTEGVL